MKKIKDMEKKIQELEIELREWISFSKSINDDWVKHLEKGFKPVDIHEGIETHIRIKEKISKLI